MIKFKKIAAKYEHFKSIQNVSDYIVECGFYYGSGTYLNKKLLNIFKPNFLSKIICFDLLDISKKIKINIIRIKLQGEFSF